MRQITQAIDFFDNGIFTVFDDEQLTNPKLKQAILRLDDTISIK